MKHTVSIEDADDYCISQQIASSSSDGKRLLVVVHLLAQTFRYILFGTVGGQRQEWTFDTLPEAIRAYNEL